MRAHHFKRFQGIALLNEIHVLLEECGVSNGLLCLLQELLRLELCELYNLVLWKELHTAISYQV